MQSPKSNGRLSPRVPSYNSQRRHSVPFLPREQNYKIYRRYSNGAPVYPSHTFYSSSLSSSAEEITGDRNKNEDESGNPLTVSVIGLILIVLCFVYAIFVSMICTTLFGVISAALSNFRKKKREEKSEVPKISRPSINQGCIKNSSKENKNNFLLHCDIFQQGQTKDHRVVP